jgi:hypothetical protein
MPLPHLVRQQAGSYSDCGVPVNVAFTHLTSLWQAGANSDCDVPTDVAATHLTSLWPAGANSDCGVPANMTAAHFTVCGQARSGWLALFALWRYAQHFLHRRQPCCNFLSARQPQAAHAVLESLSTQRRQVKVG